LAGFLLLLRIKRSPHHVDRKHVEKPLRAAKNNYNNNKKVSKRRRLRRF
jgi:hypothetical protein